ncbi:hypothetical protein R6242_14235 [Iodobacter sp. CM08]|uniref:hypothetical protein n=1 Tax=Iodobacter sp. CM08 TaxID=3085902 RepID=UPI002981CA31|nr:hypothetical protein [Iodobacter sp. CM08]MDW5417725.1 hypothetical protein [Iodobacter sp. CM08]
MKCSLTLSAFMVTLLSGCATHNEILKDRPQGTLSSSRSAKAFAQCIDRNADSYALGSLRSKIVSTENEPLEIVILNGAMHWAIIHIRTTENGSTAEFYLGGAARITPTTSIESISTGCK